MKTAKTISKSGQKLNSAYKDGRCVFCGGHECNDENPCKWRKSISGDVYPEDLVDQALHNVQDLLERTQIPFVLLGDIVERIVNRKSIGGIEKLEIGVFQKNLTDSTLSSLKSEMGDITTDYGFGYKFDRIPIEIKIVSSDYGFFKNPDVIFYKSGEYRIPNPIEDYLKEKQNI